jgi:hypothetical protein
MAILSTAMLIAILPSGARAEDPPVDPEVAAANARKAVADARTAEANADKAASEAATAAAKARFGSLAEVDNDGAVTAATDSGKMEAALLASEATRTISDKIAGRLCQAIKSGSATSNCNKVVAAGTIATSDSTAPTVIITSEATPLDFGAWTAFLMQSESITRQMELAQHALRTYVPQSPPKARAVEASTSLPGALTAVSVISNLLRSQYSLSSISLTPDEMLIAKAIMQSARTKGLVNPFIVPGLYAAPALPATLSSDSDPVVVKIKALDQLRDRTDQMLQAARRLQADSEKRGAKDPKAKKDAEEYAARIAALDAALKRYDTYIVTATAPDAQGAVAISAASGQGRLAKLIEAGGYVLIIKGNAMGGSAFSEQNFFTFLGSLPYSVSGGALVSYTLFNGATGSVVDSGSFGATAPFMKIHRITQRYKKGYPAD